MGIGGIRHGIQRRCTREIRRGKGEGGGFSVPNKEEGDVEGATGKPRRSKIEEDPEDRIDKSSSWVPTKHKDGLCRKYPR